MIGELIAPLLRRGVRIRAEGGALKVTAPPGVLSEGDRASLRESKPELLEYLARMDADLAEALQVLDDLAARPKTTPALREVIRIRADVYRLYRDRLDPTDLAEDARHFADRITNPPPRDHDWLAPRDRR